MVEAVAAQQSPDGRAWPHLVFWKMLASDLVLIGVTAMVFPGRTGLPLGVMVAAIALVTFVLNVIFVPVARLPAPDPRAVLLRRSLKAQEVERVAVAEQLRATAAQNLAALSLHLAAARSSTADGAVLAPLEVAQQLAGEILVEIATLADQIAPAWRGEFGLVPALDALQQRVAQRGLLACELRISGEAFPIRLPLTQALLRVAEAAVDNVERYAGGRSVTLDVAFDSPIVRLQVIDGARGFDPAIIERGECGLGLFRARELLAHEGGTMQIESAPGRGTRILATCEISHEAAA